MKEMENLHAHYSSLVSKQAEEISILTSKLKDETNHRVRSDIKLRESEVMIKGVK